MKRVVALILITTSFSAFADFLCVEARNGNNYLFRNNANPLVVEDIQECRKSVEKSRNGFTCALLKQTQTARGGIHLVHAGSNNAVQLKTMEECQEIVDRSKNGYACRATPYYTYLFSKDSGAMEVASLEKCYEAIENSKSSIE